MDGNMSHSFQQTELCNITMGKNKQPHQVTQTHGSSAVVFVAAFTSHWTISMAGSFCLLVAFWICHSWPLASWQTDKSVRSRRGRSGDIFIIAIIEWYEQTKDYAVRNYRRRYPPLIHPGCIPYSFATRAFSITSDN